MAQDLLPLFPLPLVLFPRTQLPLHIFEERYKEMIGEAVRGSSEFGVVLAGDQGLAEVGCTAVVEKLVHRYPDGRLDILTKGLRRFEIVNLDTEKPYMRAEVSFFNDEDTSKTGGSVRDKVISGFQELRGLMKDPAVREPEWQDPQLSFQLAQGIPDLDFRQKLLIVRSEAERMRLLAEFLPGHLNEQRHIHHVRSVAPHNGRGPTLELS